MNASEYIKTFRLDQVNYQYNRQKFIDTMGKDFADTVNQANFPNHISYATFKKIVAEFNTKFKAIQDNSICKPSDGVWSAFYVQYVLQLRHNLFTFKDYLIRKRKGYASQLTVIGKKVMP